MKTKTKKPDVKKVQSQRSDLDEARQVKAQVMLALESADDLDLPKLTDAYTRICNAIRQLERARRRDLALYSIEEIAAYIQTLDERKRESLIDQIQVGDEDDIDDEDDDRPEAH